MNNTDEYDEYGEQQAGGAPGGPGGGRVAGPLEAKHSAIQAGGAGCCSESQARKCSYGVVESPEAKRQLLLNEILELTAQRNRIAATIHFELVKLKAAIRRRNYEEVRADEASERAETEELRADYALRLRNIERWD